LLKTLKSIVIFITIVLALVIGSWGVVFASADRMLELSPAPGTTVADEHPVITAQWINIPGVAVQDLEVILDDQPQPLAAAEGTGFGLRPEEPLGQGEHTVKVRLTYGLGVPKTIEAEWRFTVDTEPPPLALAGEAEFFVSAEPAAEVPVVTEAGAAVEARLNGKLVKELIAGSDGNLQVKLTGLEEQNELLLTAADEAGNRRSVLLPVIKDEIDPVIVSVKPEEGETARDMVPMVEVVFEEENSGLQSMKLILNGTEAAAKDDDGTKRLTYLGDLLVDGTHQARVEAVDYAGRQVVKEWEFTVDSRRIVVKRGERKLYFYQGGALQKVYNVAVGLPGYETPIGSWRIVSKQVNPTWYNPGSPWAASMPRTIGPGAGNPLGTRALALNVGAVLIHGTFDYDSIGRAASRGCVRMRNHELVQFFPLVGVDTPVDILP
jgi:lipoprotein-anchoring transpeptidase ErfK/SrfK